MKFPKRTKDVAQLLVIRKLKYTILEVNQFPFFTVNLCLTNDDRTTLQFILKKQGNLGKDQEPSNIELIISFSTRQKRVQGLIELITDVEKVKNIVQTIHIQDTFLFTYDMRKFANVKGDYPDPRHDVDDFKSGARIAIEFQVVLHNFKVSKRVDAIKAYFFQLLGVYLINKPTNSIILILEKQRWGDDEQIVIPPRTKKKITSINTLEC